jgi:hypothetical protein
VDATFIFMMLALKIPIVALICLVWWAIKQEPEPASSPGGEGGTKVPPHPRHPRRPLPRPPRRGPHGGQVVPSPPRVRSVVARARQTHGDHV